MDRIQLANTIVYVVILKDMSIIEILKVNHF